MSNYTKGLNRNPGDEGSGWTGVTDDDKRYSGGKAPLGAGETTRAYMAARNAEQVAESWGSGYWTHQSAWGWWQ